jgi:hypothetical protein
MNRRQAEAWVYELTALLTGKNLISVGVTAYGVDVRQNQSFQKAYYVEHAEDKCSVALSYSYGVMTGATDWYVRPDLRLVGCTVKNGYDVLLHYVWAIADPNDAGELWQYMNDMQKRLWKVE